MIITSTGGGNGKGRSHNGLERLSPTRRYVQVNNCCIKQTEIIVVHSYWDYLEASYDWVSTELIGKSFEGQDMRVLKVSSQPANFLIHSVTFCLSIDSEGNTV